MKVDWNFYSRRRRINTARFIQKNNCNTFDDFCNVLRSRDIEPPDRQEMLDFFPLPAPKPKASKKPKVEPEPQAEVVEVEDKPEPEPEQEAKVPRKSTRRRPASRHQKLGLESSKKDTE